MFSNSPERHNEDTQQASYRGRQEKTRSLPVCWLPLHDMASDTAPSEGQNRLYELLEKTVAAVTKLNDSIIDLAESQSRAQNRRPTQVSPVHSNLRFILELTLLGGAAKS